MVLVGAGPSESANAFDAIGDERGSLNVFAFARPLNPVGAETLDAELRGHVGAGAVGEYSFRVTPDPDLTGSISGGVPLLALDAGKPGRIAATVERLLDAASAGSTSNGTAVDRAASRELAALAAAPASYEVHSLLTDANTANSVRAPLLLWAVRHGVSVTETSRKKAEPVTTSAADPVEGWGPDWGQWYFNFERDIVNGLGDTLGSEYEYYSSFSWASYDQLRTLRLAGAASGFEMNLAYKDYPNELTRSGATSGSGGWASNMPGAYQETTKIDDSLTTYTVGSHEAEKLRWRFESSPNFSEGYWVTHFVQDRFKYEVQSAKPAHSVYAQYDKDMLCGGAGADACFFQNGSVNLWNNYFCKDRTQNPVDIRVWDFRGASPTFSGVCL